MMSLAASMYVIDADTSATSLADTQFSASALETMSPSATMYVID